MLLNQDIAERVREGRRRLGLSQSDLAKTAHVSRATIARVEGGAADSVSLGVMQRVLNAANWDLRLERGVVPSSSTTSFDVEAYLDSLYGEAR